MHVLAVAGYVCQALVRISNASAGATKNIMSFSEPRPMCMHEPDLAAASPVSPWLFRRCPAAQHDWACLG